MNHHDSLFKLAFSFPDLVAGYLKAELPPATWGKLDLGSLKLENESYISEDLRQSYSDVVYTAQLKSGSLLRLAFLLEHKSFQPDCIHQQLLKYMSGIWEKQRLQKGWRKKFTYILPFLVYHGEKPWQQHTFHDCFEAGDEGFGRFVPQFDFYLTDLGRMELETINQKYNEISLQILFRLFWAAYKNEAFQERFLEILDGLQNLLEGTKKHSLARAMVTYLIRSSQMGEETLKEKILLLPQPLKENIMSTYDQILARGKEEGQYEKSVQTAENCLKKGLSVDVTTEITGLSLKEVEQIAKRLGI